MRCVRRHPWRINVLRPFAIFLTLVVVYLTAVDLSGADKWSSDQKQIVAANNGYLKAILNADIASLMKFYADDVVLLPPSEPEIVGKEAVRIYWSEAMKQVTTVEGASLFDEIVVFGDWAYARGKYEGRSRLTSDGREFEDRLNFSGLWRRDSDGSWRIARDMWNSGDDGE